MTTGAPGHRPAAHLVLPATVDDPRTPSGGNTYDRRVRDGLVDAGWDVTVSVVPWDRPPPAAAFDALDRALAAVPPGTPTLLDGLVACPVPEVVRRHARRLRLAVLVHLPLADETGLPAEVAAELDARERRTLHAAAAVVATSHWAGRRLIRRHHLPVAAVHVAPPGVDPAPVVPPGDGTRLLCVAAVTPRKGQDVLVEALAMLADRPWRCTLVGALDRAPAFADAVRAAAVRHGFADRVRLMGPLAGTALAAGYADADLLVLPSRAETYGMVVTEALARGLPVVATDVGGVPEALGCAPDGCRPGLLVPPDDPAALAAALARWFDEPDTRDRLRAAASARRATLPDWSTTVRAVASVLAGLGGVVAPGATGGAAQPLTPVRGGP